MNLSRKPFKKAVMRIVTKLTVKSFVLFFFLLVAGRNSAYAQINVVADPALSYVDITDLASGPVDANNLVDGSFYLVQLSIQNLHPVNAIPPNTAYIRLGLGLNMVIDPTFNLGTAPYNEYFTWSYDNSQSQPFIVGILHDFLPAFFDGVAIFRVKAIIPPATPTQVTSTVSGQFLNANPPGNPYRLIDQNPNNNSALIDYTVIVGSPTPVTLTSFKAVKKDCIIKTDWTVQNEINFDHYELQVSKDGLNFVSVSNVTAQNKTNYSASFDINNLADQLQGNTLYLRLKMVDRDASFKYSDIVPVNGKCNTSPPFVIYGYPNPVIDVNHITIASKEGLFNGKYNLTVMDMTGRVYITKEVDLRNVQSFRFDLGAVLANGKYLIRVQQSNGSQKGIVQFEKL